MGISANVVRLGWLMLLGCLLAGCKAISAADSADDIKKWQGTWKLVACTYNGEPQMADMEWIVDGDHYNIRLNGHLHSICQARREPEADRTSFIMRRRRGLMEAS
jgi:hypothetical protein